MAIDADTFRTVLSRWAAGVSVVTMPKGDDYHGITVSSFTSLSLEPPLVLVCIEKEARSHGLINQAGAFGVNMLHAGQVKVSDLFAGRITVEEAGGQPEIERLETGTPLFTDCLAHLDCTLHDTADGGSHTIFIGRVESGAVVKLEAKPLVYYHRRYREIKE